MGTFWRSDYWTTLWDKIFKHREILFVVVLLVKENVITEFHLVGWMQKGRKWHFAWNWVVYTYWKYRQNDTFWPIQVVQVSSQSIHIFKEETRCQKNNKIQKNCFSRKRTRMHLRPYCIHLTIWFGFFTPWTWVLNFCMLF